KPYNNYLILPVNYKPKYHHNTRETNCRTTCTTRQISNSCSCRS
ncbi:unnamed protein product, partial [Callosobruchus maculatus]